MRASLVSLGHLLRLERRRVAVDANGLYPEVGVYCFGRGLFHKLPRLGIEVGDKHLFEIHDRDFILQVTFAWEGAVAVARKNDEGFYGSVRVLTFRADEEHCIPEYLQYYFRTPEGLEQLGRISPGSAGRNRVLSAKRISEIMIPLPPLSEQRRIVAKIEQLAAKIEEALGLRSLVSKETEILNVSSSSKIFDELATKWQKEPLEKYVKLQGGFAFKSDEYLPKGLPIIRISNLENESVHINGSPFIDPSRLKEFDRFVLKPFDILIAMTGATTGKLGVVPDDCDKWLLNQRVGRFLPKSIEKLESKYVYWLARAVQKHIFETAYGGAQPNISPTDIESMQFPFPPVDEQRRIVAYLDSLQAKVDRLKALQAQTAAELEALLPSVLDRAFKGEL